MATKSESLEIEHLGTGESKDVTLLAAVTGQEHRIFGWHLLCQGPRDNKLRNRWIISDGQLFDTGSIEIDLLPWDGDNITVTDNAGNSATFEFDNNSSVTGDNIAVTIGSSTTAAATNLYNAIIAQTWDLDKSLDSGNQTINFVEERWSGSNSISESTAGGRIAVTDFNGGGGSILAQGYAFNHQPHVSSFAFGGTITAPVSVQGSTNTALNLSVLGDNGMTLVGNIYYATE